MPISGTSVPLPAHQLSLKLEVFEDDVARKDARQKALDEASSVLGAEEFSSRNHLEDFNLLGVVTSPRMLDMTRHQRDGHMASIQSSNNLHSKGSDGERIRNDSSVKHLTTTKNNNNNGNLETNMADFGLSVNNASGDSKFLSSMTESISKEIEALNSVLHSYSQSYLGSYYLSENDGALDFEAELGYEDLPTIQIEDLPEEIVNLDLTSVETFFRKSGAHATRFGLRSEESEMFLADNDDADIMAPGNLGSSADLQIDATEKEDFTPVDSISTVPEIFFSPYFDLTDPKIFESLLVLGEDDEYQSNGIMTSSEAKISRDKTGSKIRIQQPDKFTQHLDTIELALLNQVRSKSESFFRETNRFTYLKSLVAESVREVESLRGELQIIKERSIADVELIPVMAKRRHDMNVLEQILDEITHIVEVKSGVSGLIAASDYLGAVEAINLARRLLNGDYSKDERRGSSQRYMLGKLTALNKINDQLSQYENLVVMDLSNELVQIFLSWDGGRNINNSGNMSRSKSMIPAERRLKVKQIIESLRKCRKLTTMANLYKEKVCDTIRVTIRTTISECAADAIKGASLNEKEDTMKGKDGTTKTDEDTLGIFSMAPKASITDGVTSMSFEQCMDCLLMIFEQVLGSLQSASGVSKFCLEEGISFKDEEYSEESKTSNISKVSQSLSLASPSALATASDLSLKSVSEILRLRKEAHSLISFGEMRRLWDSSIAFTLQVEKFSGQKAYGLRSTLLSQAKAFVERKHEANMASLVAALDAERWTQCDISDDRQTSLTRLCSGRAVLSSSTDDKSLSDTDMNTNNPFAEVDGKQYRVVWSSLLLVEMIMNNVACAAHFQSLAANIVSKVSEILRLFNARTSQLVLGAGAIQSAARLKSINAKHLALVTQCVGLVLTILPHVRAALMAQLPNKQHTLLVDLDKIKKEYADHSEKVFSKFVSIIGGIVQHGVAPRLTQTNFDERSKTLHSKETSNEQNGKQKVDCCYFFIGIITNTRKMHQVLTSLLPPDDIKDVFSRIFAHLDSKITSIMMNADSDDSVNFTFPSSVDGKSRLMLELEEMFQTLNKFPGVRPWDFAAKKFLGHRLGVEALEESDSIQQPSQDSQSQNTIEDQLEADIALFTTKDNKEEGMHETSQIIESKHDAQTRIKCDADNEDMKETVIENEESNDNGVTKETISVNTDDVHNLRDLIEGDQDKPICDAEEKKSNDESTQFYTS